MENKLRNYEKDNYYSLKNKKWNHFTVSSNARAEKSFGNIKNISKSKIKLNNIKLKYLFIISYISIKYSDFEISKFVTYADNAGVKVHTLILYFGCKIKRKQKKRRGKAILDIIMI